MTVVLDASALVRLLDPETESVVSAHLKDVSMVLAPDLIIAEVTSALWKYVTHDKLSAADAADKLDFAVSFVDRYYSLKELAQEALREAAIHRHAVYDLYYAVLARREGAAILTFDGRLKELCGKMHIPLADA